MKHNRAEWELSLKVKSKCADLGDPASKKYIKITGSWNPEKRTAGQCIAGDLAEALSAVSGILIPSTKREVMEAFAEILQDLDFASDEG